MDGGADSMNSTTEAGFVLALNAFDIFTIDERRRALEEFARLRCPSIEDRFFEAVHRVITAKDKAT